MVSKKMAAGVPVVSVIMPVYNGERFLAQTIESVLSQTLPDLELIAVDDASQDHSWEILERYAALDKRIVLIRNTVNRGHRTATNMAHRIARGEFLARNDQDDLNVPERLERQVSFLREKTDIGLLASWYYLLSEDGKTALRKPSADHSVNRWKLLFGMTFCHSTLMFRKSMFSDRDLMFRFAPAAYDYEICARMARKVRISCIKSPLVYYRIHSRGLSTYNRDGMDRSAIAISRRELRILLGRKTFPGRSLDVLRRLAIGRNLQKGDFAMVHDLFRVMERFKDLSDIDATAVHHLRRRWIRRILRAVDLKQLASLMMNKRLFDLAKADLSALLFGIAWDFPRGYLYRLRRPTSA